jgi:nitrogen-specific signal transduction histidine kinase
MPAAMAPRLCPGGLERGGDLVIEISDAGAGFDPAEAEALCRPCARRCGARGDHAGLGLAIVARIAAAQGGSLGFARREGRFCARLLPPAGRRVPSNAPGQTTRPEARACWYPPQSHWR